MFLRIANVYLIFRHSQKKTKPFGIKINIDLEATSVEKKIYIYMGHFYPFGLNTVGNSWPIITTKESKINGVMMSRGKNRLNLM